MLCDMDMSHRSFLVSVVVVAALRDPAHIVPLGEISHQAARTVDHHS